MKLLDWKGSSAIQFMMPLQTNKNNIENKNNNNLYGYGCNNPLREYQCAESSVK